MDTKTRTPKPEDLSGDLFAEAGVGGGGNAAPPNPTAIGGDDYIDMATFAERSYLPYAMSVVRGRAALTASPRGSSAKCSASTIRMATHRPTTRSCAWRRISRCAIR